MEYLLSPFEQVEIVPPMVEQLFFAMAHGGISIPSVSMENRLGGGTMNQSALQRLAQRLAPQPQPQRPDSSANVPPKVVELGDPIAETDFDNY